MTAWDDYQGPLGDTAHDLPLDDTGEPPETDYEPGDE